VLTLAREFCQYITESVEVIEAWLLQTGKLCEDIDNCNLPVEEIEEKLQVRLFTLDEKYSIDFIVH